MADQEMPEFSPQAIQAVRTVTAVNLTLSQMADQKASMLMGAALVVLTLIVGQAHDTGALPLSLLVMGVFACVTAVLAICVVMPAVRGRGPDPAHTNLLFFAAFTQLDEDEFVDRVLANLRTDEKMHRMMLRDIYQNGQVLQTKKYRLLGHAYRTTLAGLALTALLLVWESRAALLGWLT